MSYLELFKEQLENESTSIAVANDLEKRGDYLIWWYFTKLLSLSPAEIEEAHCDGWNDYGIDALRTDHEEKVHFYSFKNPEKLDADFPSTEVDKLLSGLRLLIQGQLPEANANPRLLKGVTALRKIVPKAYYIHLVTSGSGMSKDVPAKMQGFIASLQMQDSLGWGLEDADWMQKVFYAKTLPTVESPYRIELKQTPYQVRAANHESYLLTMSGEAVAAIFGKYGETLLQQNIRVAQGDTATNVQIHKTAVGDDAVNFLHYNNGIVFLADNANWDAFSSTLTMAGFQVVNGGQTIRQLWKAKASGELKGEVIVPIRIITAGGDKKFANNVTVNLNNQNRMDPSFLRSNDPEVVQLATSMRTMGWYLERREKEIAGFTTNDRSAIEANLGHSLEGRTISLREGMQAYAATFMGDPELAKRYPKQIFLGKAEDGRFEHVFSSELTAGKVIQAYQLQRAVAEYVKEFGRLKRKKSDDWKTQYSGLLGVHLVEKHGQELDVVIPPSTVFLSAIVFDDWVNVRELGVDKLIEILQAGTFDILNEEIDQLIDVRKKIKDQSKSWPTLLKSATLFDAYFEYLRRNDTGS